MSDCIIFVHGGYADYVLHVLAITKHFNPTTRIVLLGDDKNKCAANQLGIDFYHYADYSEPIPYYHLSVNGRDYEKFCFDRWFIIYNFLTKHRLNTFIHSDTDNVICHDASIVSYTNACIGDYNQNRVIVPNIFFSNRETLGKIISYYRELYTKDYPDFINEIAPYTSNRIRENPPVFLGSIHYSDMYFMMQSVLKLGLDFQVLPENGDLPHIFNGNYTNHPIVVRDGIIVHGGTGQRMFNVHFAGRSKSEAARFYNELINRQ